jgi:5'-methylthioadenosine phosphorylase
MAKRIGIIGGSGFLRGPLLEDAEERTVPTGRGEVTVFFGQDYAFVLRHGHGVYRPPHRVPHHAHVLAFQALGVDAVVGINSVGSLDLGIGPGTVVVADDYLSAHPPPTFAEDERLHIVPTLDAGLRALLLEAARATEGPVRDGGVYLETTGPRFETRAEIRFYRDHGDVIGMTAASEATLFQERGLAYAMLGIVDNLAHGLGEAPLTFDAYERQVAENEERVRGILAAIIEIYRDRRET